MYILLLKNKMKVGFQLGIIIVMMGLIYFHVREGNTRSSCVT